MYLENLALCEIVIILNNFEKIFILDGFCLCHECNNCDGCKTTTPSTTTTTRTTTATITTATITTATTTTATTTTTTMEPEWPNSNCSAQFCSLTCIDYEISIFSQFFLKILTDMMQ